MTEPNGDKADFEAKKAEALQHFHSLREDMAASGGTASKTARVKDTPHSGVALGQWIFGFSCLFACFIAREAILIQALLMLAAGVFLYKSVRSMILFAVLAEPD